MQKHERAISSMRPQPGLEALILWTAWWEAMTLAWSMHATNGRSAACGTDIPIPDNIELAGEHALFV